MNNQQMVNEFHAKHGFDRGLSLHEVIDRQDRVNGSSAGYQLKLASDMLLSISKRWENGTEDPDISSDPSTHDPRLLRAHLMVEELGELLSALAMGDEVGVLDGLADLIYVVNGTAVAFDLPLQAAFEEVHRSNMTKEVKAGGDKDVRCRKKGDTYQPPNIGLILDRHKEQTCGKSV